MGSLMPGFAAAPLHPLFVHFPVALWFVATGMLALALSGKESAWTPGIWLVHLGSLGAVAASAAGFLAAEQLGHDSAGHAFVHEHRNVMLAATALGLLTSGLAFWKRKDPSGTIRKTIVGLMVGTCLIMTAGADRGANLVYRYGAAVLNEKGPAAEGHGHGEGSGHGDGGDDDGGAGHGEGADDDGGAGHGEGAASDSASPKEPPAPSSSAAATASATASGSADPAPAASSSAPAEQGSKGHHGK